MQSGCARTQRHLFERIVAALLSIIAALLFIWVLSGNLASGEVAHADEQDAPPSCLILDAGLGDYTSCSLNWLGDGATVIAQSKGLELSTTSSPLWWSSYGTDAPATFLLGSPSGNGVVDADSIIWALDQIRASGAEGKTLVVAMGATGLPLRQYAEEMTNPTQASRADLVGFVFCGTPQNGYATMTTYPDLSIWPNIASSVGLTVQDLAPGSAYLNKLNAGVFPKACRVLSINGVVGDLSFGPTDGVATATSDFALAPTLTSQVETVQVNASIAHEANLTRLWEPYTKAQGGLITSTVDGRLVERLSSISSYENSKEVMACVTSFYETWFAGGSPITHSSNVLALDLSGSMLDSVGSGQTKLSAAKSATAGYLQTMRSYSELPLSAPINVSVLGFNTSPWTIATGYEDAAIAAVEAAGASGETNISAVLESAFATLQSSPVCADRHVLLLSDGASTEGMSASAMLASFVPRAVEAGIVIDAVGFGDTGESNEAFLKDLSAQTGGTYYQANDDYGLKVAFLQSYYASLGTALVDEELDSNDASKDIGFVDANSAALQLGVAYEGEAPKIAIRCNGVQTDEAQYDVFEDDGIISVQILNPAHGDYTVELSGSTGKMHLFAVQQRGVSKGGAVGQTTDYTVIFMIIAGVALVALLAFVFVRTRKASSAAN